jgi:hypothetical protein
MTAVLSDQPESVLILLQGEDPRDHPGIVDGYRRLQAGGRVNHLEVMPVFGPNGVQRGRAFWKEVLDRAAGHKATLIVFQYYHSRHLPDPRDTVRALKALPQDPLVVATLGDPFMNGYFNRPSIPPSFLQAAEGADLVTMTSMGALAQCVARRTRAHIALSPNAVCQVRFSQPTDKELNRDPEFSVLFIGSRNASRNPFRPNARFGRQRKRLVEALSRRFGKRFALFGHGWDGLHSNQGPIPFDQQTTTARRARVVIGGVPFSKERYYTSNRPFIQIGAGVAMVDCYVPGVETLLRPDEHWIVCDEDHLLETIESVLDWDDARLKQIGEAGAKHIFHMHTQAHRVAALLENVRRLRIFRDTGARQETYLPFFLPEVDANAEQRMAAFNWPAPLRRIGQRALNA